MSIKRGTRNGSPISRLPLVPYAAISAERVKETFRFMLFPRSALCVPRLEESINMARLRRYGAEGSGKAFGTCF